MRTRSIILGYVALILLLTAGAAQSLSGSSTVFTDDIVDGQVRYPDIKDGAVTGKKILDDSVSGADVKESTIPGFKKVYFARVMFTFDDGTESGPHAARLYGGDATGVTFVEPDYEFRITFPVNVTACAPSVTPGLVPGTTPPQLAVVNKNSHEVYTTITNAAPNTVSVRFWQVSFPGVNSFSLTLVCP